MTSTDATAPKPRRQVDSVTALREVLRDAAARLALDPDSVRCPTPNAITATAPDGTLLRLDVSRYPAAEISL